MLTIKPTEHLSGVTIQGDYDDLYDLVESIYNITGPNDDEFDMYFGVKNRLLGMCYDIRHAYQRDRNILMVDNGMDDESMKRHGVVTPKKNIYYSVEILFPEALFVAIAVPCMYIFSSRNYGFEEEIPVDMPPKPSLSQYYRDMANLDVLFTGIWQALEHAIGESETEKLLNMNARKKEMYMHYATHYIDKCNIELLKTPDDERKNKLRNITKRIIKPPVSYINLKEDFEYSAKIHGCSIYNLHDPKLEYPEEVIW